MRKKNRLPALLLTGLVLGMTGCGAQSSTESAADSSAAETSAQTAETTAAVQTEQAQKGEAACAEIVVHAGIDGVTGVDMLYGGIPVVIGQIFAVLGKSTAAEVNLRLKKDRRIV